MISSRLEQLGLEFEFFDAIDGQRIPPDLAGLVDYDFPRGRRMLGRSLSDGEVGCALSHALIYRKMVDEGTAAAYVLEDDAEPSEAFAQMVKQSVLPQDPQIEFASFFYQSLRVWRWADRRVGLGISACRPMEHPWSNLAYYLTQAAACRLWDAAVPISGVADWPVSLRQWPSAYCIDPCLVDTNRDAGDSLIHADRSILESESVPEHQETMSMLSWATPWRVLGRLASLTLLPSLFWPETFGSVENSKRFFGRVVDQVRDILLGRQIQGRL